MFSDFRQIVKERAKARGMTYAQLADLAGIKESSITSFMCENAGRVVSREELMQKVWGYEYLGDLRAVDVAIRRLREKMEDDPASPRYILTKRGVGYVMAQE